MKLLAKISAIASIIGALVFGVVFVTNYRYLLSHQPVPEPGKPFPPDVTSFPPSWAFVPALTFGVIAFVVAFFVTGMLFVRIQRNENHRRRP
jgi:hypothetical protein